MARAPVSARSAAGFGARHRRLVFAAGWLLLLSVVPWLLTTYLGGAVGLDEHAARRVEVWALRLHGAAAMLALIVLGSVLSQHVGRGWRGGKNRATGGVVLGSCALLIGSGYLLYYGGEATRDFASIVHQAVGAVATAALLLHSRKRRRRRVAEKAPQGRKQDSIPAT